MLDILVINGLIADGTGNPPYEGYLGIKEERIATMGRGQKELSAKQIIDANGMVIAPGFIDLHTHSDATLSVHNEGESTLKAGVTTECVGQCGSSVYPTGGDTEQVQNRIARSAGVKPQDVEVDWNDLDGWLGHLQRKGVGCNVVPFVGHGVIRTLAMGAEGSGGERVEPSHDELRSMKRLLSDAMQQGAFALSTGLEYAPGRNAATEELITLCKLVDSYNGAHISHMRSEDEKTISAAEEIIEIAEKSGISSSITHHKAVGKDNWGNVNHTIRLVQQARDRGVDIMVDLYPWRYFAQSNLGSLFFADRSKMPPDREAMLQMLKSTDQWSKMKAELQSQMKKMRREYQRRKRALAGLGIQAGPYDPFDPEVRYITHCPSHPEFEELSVGEVQRRMGYRDIDKVHEALRELYLADEGATLAAGGVMSEEDIITLLEYPHSAICTDGATFTGKRQLDHPATGVHPRNYGTFAKVLGYFVREKGILSLEEAVRKMTSLPAHLLNLTDRGLLREGLYADITIFDADRIANRATYGNPQVSPVGIKHVLVNGKPAVQDGQLTENLAGKPLRFC